MSGAKSRAPPWRLFPAILAIPSFAFAAGTGTTIRDALIRIHAVEKSSGETAKAIADFAAKTKGLAVALESLETENSNLTAERDQMAALCSGEHEQMEYDRRKMICDEALPSLNGRIDALAERKRRLLAERDSISPSQAQLAAAVEALKAQATQAKAAAQAVPGTAAAIARCSGLSVSAGWPQCARKALCEVAQTRAARTRAAIEALRRELATNRSELDYWGKLNADAQKGAIEAAAKYFLGEYAANQLTQTKSLNRLVREAERLSGKAGNARKAEMQAMYLRQLHQVVTRMAKPTSDLLLRGAAQKTLDAESRWSVVRDTLRVEMNYARKNDEELKQLLESPGFRDAFKSSELDSPGHDLAGSVVEDALSEVGKRLLTLEAFQANVAPQVRAAVFVRDLGYNVLLSQLSTNRVVQQSDVAGQLAKASGVLQGQYQDDILDSVACAGAGL